MHASPAGSPPPSLDTLRKKIVRDGLLKFVKGDACLPSLDLLQTLLDDGFFNLKRADVLGGLTLEWAAGLRLLSGVARPTVDEYVKGDKAYVPCQRILGQAATACGVELQAFQVLLVLKDRTLLVCSADHERYWQGTIAGVLPDAVPKGMLAKNTAKGLTSGLAMCCEFARTGGCTAARCPFAHITDGRPCQHKAGCHHAQCTIGIPFRKAEWFGWLREEDHLPVVGVQTAAGAVVQRVPDLLLKARTDAEVHRQLSRFLATVCPELPQRRADESDAQFRANVRKYLDTLATSIYRKWQRHTDQPRTLSLDNPRTSELLYGLYPPSWRAMIQDCVTGPQRGGGGRVGAGGSAMAEPRVHQPYAPCLPPATACSLRPPDVRTPSHLVVGLLAAHLPAPHAAADRDGGVTDPLVTSGASAPQPEPEPASASAAAAAAAPDSAFPPAPLPPAAVAPPRPLRGPKKCSTTPSGPQPVPDVAKMFSSWYPEADRKKVSAFAFEAASVDPPAAAPAAQA